MDSGYPSSTLSLSDSDSSIGLVPNSRHNMTSTIGQSTDVTSTACKSMLFHTASIHSLCQELEQAIVQSVNCRTANQAQVPTVSSSFEDVSTFRLLIYVSSSTQNIHRTYKMKCNSL